MITKNTGYVEYIALAFDLNIIFFLRIHPCVLVFDWPAWLSFAVCKCSMHSQIHIYQ